MRSVVLPIPHGLRVESKAFSARILALLARGEVRVRHVEVRVRLDAVILPLVEQTFVAVELILQPELQPGLVFVLCFP
jgi:hypothetical protein